MVWHTAVSIAASARLVFSRLALFRATRASASALIAARTIARRSSTLKNQGRYICAEVTVTAPVVSSLIASFTPSGYVGLEPSSSSVPNRASDTETIPPRVEVPVVASSSPRGEGEGEGEGAGSVVSRETVFASGVELETFETPPGATTCTSGEENTGVSAGGRCRGPGTRRGHSPTETLSRSTARAATRRSNASCGVNFPEKEKASSKKVLAHHGVRPPSATASTSDDAVFATPSFSFAFSSRRVESVTCNSTSSPKNRLELERGSSRELLDDAFFRFVRASRSSTRDATARQLPLEG